MLYIAICTILAIARLQWRLILEQNLPNKCNCNIWFSKTEKWEEWYSLLVPFLYFVWSSNEHQIMVQNLFVVLVYCDFAVILAHQKLCKERKHIAMLFNSRNEFHIYLKWWIVHMTPESNVEAGRKCLSAFWCQNFKILLSDF